MSFASSLSLASGDIAASNSISYDKIAEARISYGGRGRVMEVQQPGWGQQLYNKLSPPAPGFIVIGRFNPSLLQPSTGHERRQAYETPSICIPYSCFNLEFR